MELKVEPDAEETLAEATRKQGNSMNVSSIIMYKIPTSSLGALRKKFEDSGIGLDLVEFLSAMVETMDLNNQRELMQIIPDLVDFFKSVDINGDGRMEWSEFVMFVIESVVVTDPVINEQMFNVSHSLLQSAASRHGVKASKVLAEFNRLFVGLGPSVLIFEADHHEDNWIDKGMGLKLASKMADEVGQQADKDKPMTRQPKDDRMDKALKCLDFVYLGAREMLIVLRSDMSIEFHRFMARNKVHPDLIQQNGMWHFEQPYDKIQLRQMSWSRTKPKIPWKLFAISESRKVVDTWTIQVGITGIVSLVEHEEIADHSDFIKDILVINNEMLHYNYFVSCSMDKKVQIYDLATLRHKATRTGHAAGVQCLAYDNRSLLMAGGFDYKIIAWDLDAEIDRPIFQLWGHSAPICKIVSMGGIDRTISLDTAGVLRLWDSSKANPNDKEARQIDTLSFVDDTFRNFDVFTNVSSNFGTAHSIIIAAQGRKQHLYRVEDMTPKESAPLACGGVLFTYNLLMMITVHTHDVLMFSAESGDEQKKMDRGMLHLEDDLGNEVMAACLDDRQRKLILGEASGNISVYNILSGVRLKRTAKNIPFGVRDLIYSPDKTIIALAGPGELYIFDELPNEDGVDTSLRYVQAHDVDVVAIAYSHSLGLIATADCVDTLKIWDYEFMTVKAIINDFSGSKVGTLKFIENYPLLLVGDIHNNFFIVPVGPAEEALGRQRWKANSVIYRKPDAQLHNLEVLSEEEESEDEEEDEAKGGNEQDTGSLGGESKGEGVDEEKLGDVEGGVEPVLIRQSSEGSSGSDDLPYQTGTDEEEEDDADPQKPLKKKALKEYLTKIREPKCAEIIVQKSSAVVQVEEDEEEEIYQGRGSNRLLELLGKKLEKDDADDEEDEYLSESESESEDDEEMESKKAMYTSTAQPFPKKGIRVSVVCGYDDGHCAIIDLTPVMRTIGVSHLRRHEQVSNKKGYNPRRTARRYLKETEIKLTTWKAWEAENVINCRSHLSVAWAAHSSAITTLYAIQDDKNVDILTAGQDKAVYTWTLAALLKGTLTRGRDWDKLFRPRWTPPYSEAFREMNRTDDARILNDALGLAQFMHRAHGKGNAASLPGAEEAPEDGGRARGRAMITNMSLDGSQKSSITFSQKGGSASEQTLKGAGASLDISDALHVSSIGDDGDLLEDPERARVIGQLAGKVTYHQSAKDVSAAVLLEKEASQASLVAEAKEKKRRREEGRNKNMFASGTDEKVKKSSEAVWLDELMGGSSGSHVEVGVALKLAQKKIEREKNNGKRERNIKTKYDQELQQIDENDPNNWEITSSNRQRALYEKLYVEKDKAGVVKDPMLIFEHKLNNLVGGDFRAFAETVRQDRDKAMHSIAEASHEEGIPMIGMQESVVTIDPPAEPEPAPTPAIATDVAERGPDVSPTKEQRVEELERHRKKVADETYVKFRWEGSLRTPLYPSPLKDGDAPKARSLENPLSQLIAPAVDPGPVSPVRLTAAQLKAVEERDVIMAAKQEFEDKLRITEKLSRKNNRILRKKNRKVWREQREFEQEKNLSPAEKVRLEIKKGKAKKAADALSALKEGMPPIQQRNNRHSFAALVHNRSTTIDEVMEATRKQKKAEESWVRKMKYTLEDHGDELTSRTSRRSQRNKDDAEASANQSGKSVDKNRSGKLLQSRDERILQKKDFGPYKTKELMAFLRCFQTLPPEQNHDDDDSLGIPVALTTSSKGETSSTEKGAEKKAKKKDGEDGDDDDWDDFSIDSSSEEEEQEENEEEESEEEEDEEVMAVRLAEEERERVEKERQQKEDEEKAAEAKHASEVVNTNVRLLNLINTKWVQLNGQFKTEFQKVLTKRSDGGILPRNVLISLQDALTFCCPYMQLPDRQLCLRLFVLKTPRTVEHTEATEKGLTREQLRKLKAMFEFFDKDNSGGIDKYEIMEVLQKLAENKKKEVTSDKMNDDDEKGVDITDAEALIQSVAGVDQPELDFDCFVKMFKSLV